MRFLKHAAIAVQGVLQKDNRDLAIMLDNEGDAVPMAVITT